jgi:hypothetical protein
MPGAETRANAAEGVAQHGQIDGGIPRPVAMSESNLRATANAKVTRPIVAPAHFNLQEFLFNLHD